MTLSYYHITNEKVVQGLCFSPRSNYGRASLNSLFLPDRHALNAILSRNCIQMDLLGAKFLLFFFFSFLFWILLQHFKTSMQAVLMSCMSYKTLKILFHHLTYYVKLHGTETEIPLFTLIG